MPDKKSFPFEETFIDFADVPHKFIFERSLSFEDGFLVDAIEVTADKTEGYRFSSWSPSLGDALGKLRQKINDALSVRHLRQFFDLGLTMTHDKLSGHISYDGVVIDGKLLNWDEFAVLLRTREGHQFNMLISDPTD